MTQKIKFNFKQLKDERQEKTNKLLDNCGVFWAFSNESFYKNKPELKEGEKLISIGAGGYMPSSSKDDYLNGLKSIETWYKKAVKDGKQQETEILYELNNYECFITGDIENAWDYLKDSYSRVEVQNIYNKYAGTKFAAR